MPPGRLRSLSVVFTAALIAGAVSMPARAARKIELKGEVVELHTQDGWTLVARYQPAVEDQLTFILLHEARGRRANWHVLARKMVREGLGYLALDLRGHGASTGAPGEETKTWRDFRVKKENNPWENMREDVAAAVEFLKAMEVPEDAIAIGGADVGGSIALKYAALHPEIEMVFLLSPGLSYKEVLTVNAMRAFKDRPILLVVGNDDRRSATETPILYQFAKVAVGPERAALLRTRRGHGTRMFWTDKSLSGKVIEWMITPVQGGDLPPDSSSDTVEGIFEDESFGTEEGDLPSEDELERLGETPAYSPEF